MKKFISRLLMFSLPLIFIATLIVSIDFFKVFGFQDYYSSQKVVINRDTVTTTTYNHYREQEKFDAFIFGSSRSQAFKCENWKAYLGSNTNAFHFDASGEGIWGISKKIEYINELGDPIKHALVVIDRKALTITYPQEGHLYIAMPCVSKSTDTEYYYEFIKASLNLRFLSAYVDYSIFETHREYMGSYITRKKHDHIVNKKNCDIWYGWDKEIKIDSLEYYTKRIDKGTFYKRPKLESITYKVTPEEIAQLKTIKTIFDKHKTNFKIVISPLYDQIPIEKEQLMLLEDLFGKYNIYNFSGKNNFTEPIYNFYENSHYRPHVANKIMKIIY